MSIDAPMTDQSVLAGEARLQADQGRERNRKGDGQTDRADEHGDATARLGAGSRALRRAHPTLSAE